VSEFESSTTIRRSVEDVWAFISDPGNAPKWDPGVLDVRVTSAGPVRVGTTLQSVHKGGTMDITVIEYEPKVRFTLKFTRGPLEGSWVRYAMEPVEGNTKLTRTLNLRSSGSRVPRQSLAAPAETPSQEAAELTNIKRLLEAPIAVDR
jgi:uncharacterized protein YndB with AHSA1/START domain